MAPTTKQHKIQYPFLCDFCQATDMGKVVVSVTVRLDGDKIIVDTEDDFEIPDGWCDEIACSQECTGLEAEPEDAEEVEEPEDAEEVEEPEELEYSDDDNKPNICPCGAIAGPYWCPSCKAT